MTGNKSLFSSLDSSVVMDIKLGDDFMVPAKGKGIIPVLTKKNEFFFIHEVFYHTIFECQFDQYRSITL